MASGAAAATAATGAAAAAAATSARSRLSALACFFSARCWLVRARMPSGFLARLIAPSPKRMGRKCDDDAMSCRKPEWPVILVNRAAPSP